MAANMSAAYIQELFKSTEKSYTFIHLDAVDGAGHDTGWCSEGYYRQVAAADRQVILNIHMYLCQQQNLMWSH